MMGLRLLLLLLRGQRGRGAGLALDQTSFLLLLQLLLNHAVVRNIARKMRLHLLFITAHILERYILPHDEI